jgi:phage shock protein PspC (stress-responsive transcriptional regulator)
MNKVITINLDGIAYQLEEDGYDALHAYLETAAAQLKNNPDREEILSDIERAMAEKFRALLTSHKNVIEAREVTAALAEMGPIEADPAEAAGTAGAGSGPGATPPGSRPGKPGGPGGESTSPPGDMPRRLYRLYDDAMISGVCAGIAAYLNLDPTLVRLAFVLLTMLGGSGVLIYVILVIVIPEARSAEEKAAAAGGPATTQEFIRRAKEGYYEAMKNIPDRKARREWKRRFKWEMRAHARQWRHQWWGGGPKVPMPPHVGATLPLLSSLQGVITILWICALVSVLSSGSVFGLDLPSNVPVWLAVILLCILYGVLEGPLKMARHACHWSLGQSRGAWPVIFLVDAVIWVAVMLVLFCLAFHFFPELRAAIHGLPALFHQATHDIRAWWQGN